MITSYRSVLRPDADNSAIVLMPSRISIKNTTTIYHKRSRVGVNLSDPTSRLNIRPFAVGSLGVDRRSDRGVFYVEDEGGQRRRDPRRDR